MKSLITITHSRPVKGIARAIRNITEPTPMNPHILAVMKNSPISAKAISPRKLSKAGANNNNTNRTCKVVKKPTDSTLAAASSRLVLSRPDFFPDTGVPVDCWSCLGRLATFRAVLQSLNSARTDTIQPAACKCWANRAMIIE